MPAVAPIILAGMHRSGTSFVASLLRLSGVDMGVRLMPAGHGNERGHHENLDFVEFHMRQLCFAGLDESGWTAPSNLMLGPEAEAEAHDLIDSSRRDTAWGWKDPRTTLFLDFWDRVVPDARYILLYREPAEVIDSLFRRGDAAINISPELAAEAWLNHNSNVLALQRKARGRCILANVSAVAQAPHRLLRNIADRFQVNIDVDARSTFESHRMHNLQPGSPQQTLLRLLMPEVGDMYAALQRQAHIPGRDAEVNGPSAASLARSSFFGEWKRNASPRISGGTAARVPHDEGFSDALPMRDPTEEQVFWARDILSSIGKLRGELGQYNAALDHFVSKIQSLRPVTRHTLLGDPNVAEQP